MANKYFRAIIIIVFFLVSDITLAQGPPPPPPPIAPIDGGILWLFAAAVGFAVKKIHDQSKK